MLLSDTVGFINKLPSTVAAAFRATLEELHEADLLVHVIDITHPKAAEQAEVVEDTLRQLELDAKPTLLAVNKVDLLVPPGDGNRDRDLPIESRRSSVLVSAARGWNLDRLLEEIQARLGEARQQRPPVVMVGE